jgi:hypothetical protein
VLVQEVLDADHLPFDLIASNPNDVVSLVEREQLPRLEVLESDLGVDVHLERAAVEADIDGPIRVGLAKGAIVMGGAQSLSISSFRATIWLLASRSAATSFSFCLEP